MGRSKYKYAFDVPPIVEMLSQSLKQYEALCRGAATIPLSRPSDMERESNGETAGADANDEPNKYMRLGEGGSRPSFPDPATVPTRPKSRTGSITCVESTPSKTDTSEVRSILEENESEGPSEGIPPALEPKPLRTSANLLIPDLLEEDEDDGEDEDGGHDDNDRTGSVHTKHSSLAIEDEPLIQL